MDFNVMNQKSGISGKELRFQYKYYFMRPLSIQTYNITVYPAIFRRNGR